MLSVLRSVDSVALLAASDSGGGGGIASIAIFLLIPVAMYFLLIRPQRRRQKEQASQQASLQVGDEVMTTAGVYGFITGFEGDVVWLEIDENVQIRIARQAIQRKVDTSQAAGVPTMAPTDTPNDAPASADEASGD
jgi:preprotein translocase subunit YajC